MNARSTLVFALAVLFGASCTDRNPFASLEDFSAPEASLGGEITGPSLLVCPTSQTLSASGVIGVLGGVLEVGGHRVVMPAQAVLRPTRFTLTVPASDYMEISVVADGFPGYTFLQPVVVSISYDRCDRADLNGRELRTFYIDSRSKSVLEDMGGVDDKVARRVTFATAHFSGYAVGEN
jgi:hypothetical protein